MLQIAERAMGRTVLDLNLRDPPPFKQLRKSSGVQGVSEWIALLKRNWAGNFVQIQDGRWSKRIMEWRRHRDTKRRQAEDCRLAGWPKRLGGNWMQNFGTGVSRENLERPMSISGHYWLPHGDDRMAMMMLLLLLLSLMMIVMLYII